MATSNGPRGGKETQDKHVTSTKCDTTKEENLRRANYCLGGVVVSVREQERCPVSRLKGMQSHAWSMVNID